MGMINLRNALMMEKPIPDLAEWFDCGAYGLSSYGGRYFVDTGLTGLVGATTRVETSAYWSGQTNSFGNWNPLFAAQSSDGSADTIQVRRAFSIGTIIANRSDSISMTLPTSPANIVLDGQTFTVRGTTKTVDTSSIANEKPLFLGGSYGIIYSTHGDRLKRCWHGFIGRTKVFVSGLLIADMQPLADGSGFYDHVRRLILPKSDIRML